MGDEKITEHKSMTIKEGWFCYGANFDCEKPYITVAHNDTNEEEKILIPETVAYYLRTHYCGSETMRNMIREHAILDMQHKLKEILGVK